jgi:chitodextrinase
MKRKEAEKYRQAMTKASEALPDEVALETVEIFPRWEIGKNYEVGDRIRFAGELYKCLQNHRSQSDWSPDVAVSLWGPVRIGIPDWVQPTGSTDSYNKGDKVKHNDKIWISDVDNNVWEPGVYGWSEVE